jgi:hypothetical protein
MTGTRRLLIAALLALAPAAARAGTPCNDCCQLACVDAEIRYATKMQAWYRTQLAIPGLAREKYEADERARAEEFSKERARDTGNLGPCTWNLPDPKKDTVAVREWNVAHWSITSDEKGNLSYNFSLRTNTETCELTEKQVKLFHEIVPCTGMADAAEKHERFHVTSCLARKGRKETMADVARDEVAAYDVELKELSALRETIRKACAKKSCDDQTAKAAGDRLDRELDDLKKQVARRGGK